MASMFLPDMWKTKRLTVKDSTLDEVQELQQINDVLPVIRGWTGVEIEGESVDRMQDALMDGVLPPNGRKDLFRLQSIRLRLTGQLIGFLATYHGFPDADMFWIVVMAIHPSFQRQGYGSELMGELSHLVTQLEAFTRMRGFICHENLPSLRFFVGSGFDKIVTIAEDETDLRETHLMLEKAL